MPDFTRQNFVYDPLRQGYDINLWTTIQGVPSVSLGRITVNHGVAVHNGDILRGEITFSVNIPDAPGGDDSRLFGLYQPGRSAYMVFAVGANLTVQTSDGTTTDSSSTIPWDSAWEGANVDFKIRWEAGTVKYFIAGTQVYAYTGNGVPTCPTSLYLFDDSGAGTSFGSIVVNALSYYLNPKTAATGDFDGKLVMSQKITTTDVPIMLIPTLVPAINDTVTISDVPTTLIPILKPLITEAISVAENFARA